MSISFQFEGGLYLPHNYRLSISYKFRLQFILEQRKYVRTEYIIDNPSNELINQVLSVLRKQMPAGFLADFIDENIVFHKGSPEDWTRLTNFMRDYDKQQINEIGWNKTVLPNDQWIEGEVPTTQITITPTNLSTIIHGTNE